MSSHNRNPAGKGGFGDRPETINRAGRPANLASVRRLAQEIANETVTTKAGARLEISGREISNLELILRKWAQSNDVRMQLAFIEYAFGKPAQIIIQRNDTAQELIDALEERIERLASMVTADGA